MSETSARRGPHLRRVPLEVRWLIELLVALGVAWAAVEVGTRRLAIPWTVLGASMEPTLRPGDRVIVNLWTYRGRAPKPGEVALLVGPGDTPLIKRVARAPVPPPVLPASTLDPEDRGSERIWVLGDNPEESADSRLFGAVPVGRFRGKVEFRYWPLSRLGRVR